MLKLFHDSHRTATAERTEGRLVDVPPQERSWAMFSKLSLFYSAVVTNEEPSRKILAIAIGDLEMSIARKHRDLRCSTQDAPQEKWMTTCGVSVTGLELGSKVSRVDIIEFLQDPMATLREAATGCPSGHVGYLADSSFQGWS